jgi:RNA polymerase sigma-70 factor (ECF subfamily)
MCLHGARLPARSNVDRLTPLVEQDRSSWDGRLIAEGLALLEESATGEEASSYHFEAAIAAEHASAASVEQTDWGAIVSLYDRLMGVAPSPVVALNRAIAVGERDGAEGGLAAIAAIEGSERLEAYPFLHAALGELELRRARHADAQVHFQAALELARNGAERRFLRGRVLRCGAMT